jgi:hypothetical protein
MIVMARSIISESFSWNSESGEINTIRLGDCFQMAKDSDEQTLYLDHLRYIYKKSLEILASGNTVILYKKLIDSPRENIREIKEIDELISCFEKMCNNHNLSLNILK